jgi:hypothetical protein
VNHEHVLKHYFILVAVLFFVIALLAILRPAQIHVLIVVFDEFGNLCYLSVVQDASVLDYGISITLYEELG